MRFATDLITPSRTRTLCKISPGRGFVPVTINFFNSALDIGSTSDALRGEPSLNLLSSRHRVFCVTESESIRRERDSGAMNSIPLGILLPRLLPHCLVTRTSSVFPAYLYSADILIYATSRQIHSLRKIYSACQRATGDPDFEDARVGRTAFLLDGRRLFTRSLKRIRRDPADLKARTFLSRSTNNRIRGRIRSDVCYNFCKGISCFYVSCRVSSLHRIQYGRHTYVHIQRGASSDVCNKKTLAKPPSPNGHLARRDRRLLFSGEEIGRWSPFFPLFSLTLRRECAILPESFSSTLRRPARDGDVHESFPFLRRIFR